MYKTKMFIINNVHARKSWIKKVDKLKKEKKNISEWNYKGKNPELTQF